MTRGGLYLLLTGVAAMAVGPVLTVPSCAQSLPVLTPTEIKPITGSLGTSTLFSIPATCDEQGNVYIRMFAGDVTKVTAEGKVERLYTLAGVPAGDFKDAGKARVISYAVDNRGNVYVAAENSEGKTALVKFANDGDYEGVIDFSITHFYPFKTVAFAGGELLVSGFVMNEKKGEWFPQAHTAIFDPYGHLVKDVTLSGDVSTENAKDKDQLPQQYNNEPASLGLEMAIETGTVTIGWDGDAYIFRNTKSPMVFVVSPAGELVRQMALKPPSPDLWPTHSSMSGARAALVFGTLGDPTKGVMGYPKLYAVYDMQTGDLVSTYEASPKLTAAFGCYTQNAFLFIGWKQPEGQLTLIKAQPK